MMQAAESWRRDDFGSDRSAFCPFSACRSLLFQPEMRSVIEIIADVLGHEAFQMTLIQDDHMVEQIATAVANEAFRNTVLPWTAEAGSLGFDAQALDCLYDLIVEVRATVEDQIAWRGVIREGTSHLL